MGREGSQETFELTLIISITVANRRRHHEHQYRRTSKRKEGSRKEEGCASRRNILFIYLFLCTGPSKPGNLQQQERYII